MEKTTVRTGFDVLKTMNFSALNGAKVGILANAASVDSSLRHLVDLLFESRVCSIVRIFAPEHGFRGALQDMVEVETIRDPVTGVPVISLYGNSERSLYPSRELLDDLDVLVVDLPDIGTRYYTFAQTLGYAMSVCRDARVKVIVLDRPNPVGGEQVEGVGLAARCRSFCGYAPVANRHGLTLGELAQIMNDGFGEGDCAIPSINCDLIIVPVEGWERRQYFDQTGLPWVMPSPNMPSLETALVYPGTCLFEATNMSEGRGTTRPFELVGAPFIDGPAWAKQTMEETELEGAALRPVDFIPQFGKWHHKACHGVQIHVTDREKFKPFRWGLALINAAARHYPTEFAWRDQPYEFVANVPAIDLLFGNHEFRKAIDTRTPLAKIIAQLVDFEKNYAEARKSFLLYGQEQTN